MAVGGGFLQNELIWEFQTKSMPSRFPAPAIVDHWTPRLWGEVKAAPCHMRLPCPRAGDGSGWGRLDISPTGGVFPARLETGIAAPPHLEARSEAGSGPISVLEGQVKECRLHCYFRARAARWSEWAGRWRRPIRRRVGSSTKSMRRLARTSQLSFGRAPPKSLL